MTLCTLFAAAQIGGVFPLLCTPYAEDGSLDCETLHCMFDCPAITYTSPT